MLCVVSDVHFRKGGTCYARDGTVAHWVHRVGPSEACAIHPTHPCIEQLLMIFSLLVTCLFTLSASIYVRDKPPGVPLIARVTVSSGPRKQRCTACRYKTDLTNLHSTSWGGCRARWRCSLQSKMNPEAQYNALLSYLRTGRSVSDERVLEKGWDF